MNEREEVENIVDDIELRDHFVIHGIHSVWSNGTMIRRYQGQNEQSTKSPAKGFRKMVAILVEVRGE